MSHIVAYFVTQLVTDGEVAGDLKTINKLAENFFYLAMSRTFSLLKSTDHYVKAKCLPKMRKDRVSLKNSHKVRRIRYSIC